MKFFHTVCRMCGEYLFNLNEVAAFRHSSAGLRSIDLDGQQPWCGVFCVCHGCIEAISKVHNEIQAN